MEKALLDIFHGCVVRLVGPQGEGTGFFIAPGWILTCAHVVEERKGVSARNPIRASFQGSEVEARVIRFLSSPYPDLALLEADVPGHPCVSLDAQVLLGDRMEARAFTAQHPGGESTTLEFEGLALGKRGEEFLKLKGGQVVAGFSGAPLLNLRTLRVCGIVKSTRERTSDLGGRAIPVSLILRELPGITERQANLLARDQRWEDARERQLSPSWEAVELYLSRAAEKFSETMEAHVPLRFHPVTKDGPADGVRAGFAEENLLSWLGQERRLLIVGPSGSGKTWLCRRLIARFAAGAGGEDARIPVYIEAHRYREPYRHRGGLRLLVASEIERIGGFEARISAEGLAAGLARGRFLLVFDSLNEIAGPLLHEAVREIVDLCEVFPKAAVVLTCQTFGFSDLIQGLGGQGFRALAVDELTDLEIAGFLAKFAAPELENAVWSNLPRIPLVLKLLLEAPEGLPKALTLPQLLDQTVGFITRTKDLLPDRPRESRLRASLAHLACRALVLRRVPPLRREEALEILDELPGPSGSGEALLSDLCIGGLLEEAAGDIRFAHEAFFHYFVALSLKERWAEPGARQELRKHLHEKSWHEPFAFAVALMDSGDAVGAVRQVLDQPLLVARCFHSLGASASQELAASKEEFLRDQRTALAIAATDWPKILVFVFVGAVGALSLSAFLGWTSPPGVYIWLSGVGEAWTIGPNSASRQLWVLAFALLITAAVGELLERTMRLYDRRVLASSVEPLLDALVLLHPQDARAELARLTADLQRPLVLNGVREAVERAELQVAGHAEVLAVLSWHRRHQPHEVLSALEVVERHAPRAMEDDIVAVAETLDSPSPEVHLLALRVLRGIHRSRPENREQVQEALQLRAAREALEDRRTGLSEALAEMTGKAWIRARLRRGLQWLRSPSASGLTRVVKGSLWEALLAFLLIGIILTVLRELVLLAARQ